MRKLLILGGSGFVGRYLRAAAGPAAVATGCRHGDDGMVRFDAGTQRLRDTLLAGDHGFSHAVVLGGVTNMDRCAKDPQGTGAVNVDGMKRVIEDLVAAGVHPIYTSSDAVFDGSRGDWTETDPTCPSTVYGAQKAEMEAFVSSLDRPWTIIRFSKVVACDVGIHSLFGEWLEAVEAGRPIRAAADQVFSPAHVDDVTGAILDLARRGLTGLFNVAGPQGLSRYQLARMFLDALAARRPVSVPLESCSLHDFPFAEKRPLNSSLSPAKLYAALGTTFRGMEAVCADAVRQTCGATP